MPLKLNVGTSQKVGLPHYSSLGAACHLEIELDGNLIDRNPEALDEHIQMAYRVCGRAVQEELSRQRALLASEENLASEQSARDRPHPEPTHEALTSAASDKPFLTERQLAYLRKLAAQIRELGAPSLETLAPHLVGSPVEELTSQQASTLIDTLKAIREGEVELASVCPEFVTSHKPANFVTSEV